MLVTLEGIVTDVKPLHQKNAEDPMLVTLEGIVTDVKPLQSSNADSPILVTPNGIVTEVRPVQLKNANPPTPATGQPPSFDGIFSVPVGSGEIAGELVEEVIIATPLETTYDQEVI